MLIYSQYATIFELAWLLVAAAMAVCGSGARSEACSHVIPTVRVSQTRSRCDSTPEHALPQLRSLWTCSCSARTQAPYNSRYAIRRACAHFFAQ